jgi:type I restriction enzyme S subunit
VFALNPPKPAADALPARGLVSFVPIGAVDSEAGAIIAPEERRFEEVRKGYTAFTDGDVIMAKITPCFENGKAAVAVGLKNALGFGDVRSVFRTV